MKTRSSLGRIVWSIAYVLLVLVTSRFAPTSHSLYGGATSQQNQLKSLEEPFSTNPQVRITKVKVGANVRQFKEEFDESDDWPRKLLLEVENIATKPIIYLQINLNFPETRVSGDMMSYRIPHGVRPNSKTAGPKQPLRLMPGEKLEIVVNEHYEDLARFISTRHRMSQIHKAQIVIGFIVFEDGTAWTAGDFLRPDPNNPNHYINIGPAIPN